MLNSKTVFILGAGASYEVGFPLGSELKKLISSKLDLYFDTVGKLIRGDRGIYDKLLSKYRNDINDYWVACRQISNGIVWSDSIDDFINQHNHDERFSICGKLAIAYSILQAERNSKLFYEIINGDESLDYDSLKNTWYAKFYSLLNKRSEKQNIDNFFNNVTVINFNYDRSLEHFLINSISNNHVIGKDEAKNIVNKLMIYRPYGSIAKSVEFGAKQHPELDVIVSNLKTYTEQVDDVESLNQVKQAIQEAGVLVFLGMAYHPNNINLLQTHCDEMSKKIYATRVGISDDDLPVVRRRIMNMLRPDAYLSTTHTIHEKNALERILFADECTNLFDKYKMSLSEH